MLSPAQYNNALRSYQDLFNSIFGVHMTFYFKPIVGFRLDRFEVHLRIPDNMSIRKFVREGYGSEGEKLIEHLITL